MSNGIRRRVGSQKFRDVSVEPCFYINIAEYREVHTDSICSHNSLEHVDIKGHPMAFLHKNKEAETAPTRLRASTRSCVVSTTLRLIYPWKRPRSHTTGGWLSLWAGLGGMENIARIGT